MTTRGSSLVELLSALAVAGLVASVAATALGSVGLASRHHLLATERDDSARLALAVLADDLAESTSWGVCTEARDCPLTVEHRPYRSYVLHAGVADWLIGDGLRRCLSICDVLIDDVVRLDVIGDIADDNGVVRRAPLLQWHGNTARLLEVSIMFADGTRFSRVVAKR